MPPGQALKLVNNSASHMPRHFSNCWFYALSPWAFFSCCLLKGWHSLQVLSELSLLIVNVQVLSPCWLYEFTNFSLSGFQSQMLWGFIFPTWVYQCEGLFLSHVYTCISFPLIHNSTGSFSSPPCLCPSYLLRYGLFPTFSCGICSACVLIS